MNSTDQKLANLPFRVQDISNESPAGATYHVVKHLKQHKENNPRRPGSIHFSGFWKCAQAMLWEAYGVPKTDWYYNWSNDQAMRAGDSLHGQIQAEMTEAGLTSLIPVTDEDEDFQRIGRDLGLVKPGIEVTIGQYLKPFSEAQELIYAEKGYSFSTRLSSLYSDYVAYGLGGRLDVIYTRPGAGCSPLGELYCDFETPYELKTIFDKYAEGGESEQYMYGPGGNWAHYFMQNMMQVHWWRCSRCGRQPSKGIVGLIQRGDTSKRVEKELRYDREMVEGWLPRIKAIKEAWTAGAVLPGEPSEDNCKFCDYHKLCQHPGKGKRFVDFKSLRARKAARLAAETDYLTELMKAS